MQATLAWRAVAAETLPRRPWATYMLMLFVCGGMLIEVTVARTGAGLQAFALQHGLVAADFSWFNPSAWLSLITFNFLHASGKHFAVNAYIMLMAGIAVERHIGRRATLFVWLAGGIVSGIVHLMMFPGADKALIGASGAVSALLGAAMIIGWHWGLPVKFRREGRIFFRIRLPVVIGLWLLGQLYSVFNLFTGAIESPVVATWVHVAGFAFGALVACALILHRGSKTVSQQLP